jgi:hypothetical protein
VRERDWSSHDGDVGSHGNNGGRHGGGVGEGHEVKRSRDYWDEAKQGEHDRAENNIGEKKGGRIRKKRGKKGEKSENEGEKIENE